MSTEADRVEELVAYLYWHGGLDELEPALGRVRERHALSEEETRSWQYYHALAAHIRGDREAGLERFLEAWRADPESPRVRFSLGQAYEQCGEPGKMFELFDQARFPEIDGHWSLAQARYAYLWEAPGKGLAYLQPLIERYHELGIADDMFIQSRDLPFVNQVMSTALALHVEQGTFDAARSLLDRTMEKLPDHQLDAALELLRATREHDVRPIMQELEDSVCDQDHLCCRDAFSLMRLAVLRAQVAPNPVVAEEHLRSVQLMEEDEPWLEDVRALGLARLAHGRGDERGERELIERFLQTQPMLLEPGQALTFHLLEYQRTLKQGYQRATQGAELEA